MKLLALITALLVVLAQLVGAQHNKAAKAKTNDVMLDCMDAKGVEKIFVIFKDTQKVQFSSANGGLIGSYRETSTEYFFTFPFNLSQQPACSIPCGFTQDGLPIGLQIVADNFREDLVLRAAKAFETIRPIDRCPDL